MGSSPYWFSLLSIFHQTKANDLLLFLQERWQIAFEFFIKLKKCKEIWRVFWWLFYREVLEATGVDMDMRLLVNDDVYCFVEKWPV